MSREKAIFYPAVRPSAAWVVCAKTNEILPGKIGWRRNMDFAGERIAVPPEPIRKVVVAFFAAIAYNRTTAEGSLPAEDARPFGHSCR